MSAPEKAPPDLVAEALAIIVEHDPAEEWPFSVRLNIHALAKSALLMGQHGKEIEDAEDPNGLRA